MEHLHKLKHTDFFILSHSTYYIISISYLVFIDTVFTIVYNPCEDPVSSFDSNICANIIPFHKGDLKFFQIWKK